MMTVPVDRRVIKTQKAIKNAFVELLLEKQLKDIKVKSLTERADINRRTFYQHYEDIYDLLNELEDEIIDEFSLALDEATILSPVGDKSELEDALFTLLNKILSYVKENENLIAALFREDQDTKIKAKLHKYLFKIVAKHFLRDHQNSTEEFEYFFGYVTSGCVEVITLWIRGGLKQEPKDLAKMLDQFIINGADCLLKHKIIQVSI